MNNRVSEIVNTKYIQAHIVKWTTWLVKELIRSGFKNKVKWALGLVKVLIEGSFKHTKLCE